MLGKHIRLVFAAKEELMKLAFISLVVLTNLERLNYYINLKINISSEFPYNL